MWDALKVLAVTGGIGAATLPLTGVLLAGLPGAGAGISRPLGLLLAGFAVWLIVSVGVVPYTTVTAWCAVGGLFAVGLWVRRTRRRAMRATGASRATPEDRALLLGAEVVFVVAFVLGCLLTAFAPDVVGTEKPMDMMLLDTSMTSRQLPPRDLWLAGEELNYYYLGSWLLGFVMKVAAVAPDRAYNLGVGLVFGLSCSAVFGVAGALARAVAGARRAVPAAAVATGFTMLAGNLQGLKLVLEHDGPVRSLNWFAASRVTPGGADDFPFFATLLGDLHAHLIAVPFTLVVVGLAMHAAVAGPLAGSRAVAAARLVVAAVALGALFAMHTWTYPVALVLLLASGAVGVAARRTRTSTSTSTRGCHVPATLSVAETSHPPRRAAIWGGWALAVTLGSGLLYLPFHLTFDPSPGGIGRVTDPPSLLTFLERVALTHGVLLGIVVLAAAARLLSARRSRRAGPSPADVLPLAGTAASQRATPRHRAETFLWLLVALGAGCLLLPQFVYVRDAFDGGPDYRFNTVFKFGFQAWPLLGVACGALVLLLLQGIGRRAAPIALAALAVAAVASSVFPVAGSIARTDGFAGPPRLGGLRWMERTAPGDVAAIRWLREHVDADAVVLEASGPEYSYGGRIATFSGRATVIAWAGHELVWGQPIGTREADVAAIYRATDPAVALALLERYRVDYIVLGAYERSTGARAATVAALGPRVFTAGGTSIHRVAATSSRDVTP